MSLRCSITAEDGRVHTAHGTNIVPGFPAGTRIKGFWINGCYFRGMEVGISTGEDMVIPLDKVRDVMRSRPTTKAPA